MQRTQTTDIRIKRFMNKKMRKYPELENVNQPRVAHQRGYSWGNMFNALQVKRG